MNKNILNNKVPFIGFFIGILIISCSVQNKTIIKNQKIKKINTKYLLDSVNNNMFSCSWLRLKGNSTIDYNAERNKIKINIRLKNDSALWVNLSKSGVQIITTLLSKDSIKFLKKLGGKEYFLGSFEELDSMLNLDIDYNLIQNFILGNPLILNEKDKYKSSIEDSSYVLSSFRSKKMNRIQTAHRTKKHNFLYKCWINANNFKCQKIEIILLDKDISILSTYNNWIKIDNMLMPLERNIEYISYQDSIKINLTYSSKIKLDERQSMPFKIKDEYTPFRIENNE